MKFKQLSNIEKLFLKLTDGRGYRKYKRELQAHLEAEFYLQQTRQLKHVSLNHAFKQITSFKHSGNSGDIIYSLPATFALAKNGKANFYIDVNQPANYGSMYHPLGNVLMNDKMADMLLPLLQYQDQIGIAKKYRGEPLDYNLDEFRNYSFYLDRGSIVRWYFNVYGISYNTANPWLNAPKDNQFSNCIVIARSHRYHAPLVDYGFLKKYPDKLFIGIEEEYEDMKQVLPDLQFKPVNDFLEMATIINSCKLFIGNQSFPFSIAEALKVTRLLESYYKVPNVIVDGPGGNDFLYQPQFEYAVKRLYEE